MKKNHLTNYYSNLEPGVYCLGENMFVLTPENTVEVHPKDDQILLNKILDAINESKVNPINIQALKLIEEYRDQLEIRRNMQTFTFRKTDGYKDVVVCLLEKREAFSCGDWVRKINAFEELLRETDDTVTLKFNPKFIESYLDPGTMFLPK